MMHHAAHRAVIRAHRVPALESLLHRAVEQGMLPPGGASPVWQVWRTLSTAGVLCAASDDITSSSGPAASATAAVSGTRHHGTASQGAQEASSAESTTHTHSPRDAAGSAGDAAKALEERLLQAALRHIPRLGWSQAALVAATADLGISPAAAGLVGSSDAEFVQAFNALCNSRLESQLAEMADTLAGMRVLDRVHTGVRLRLQMLAPYIDSWPRALALLAQPAALPRTLRQYAEVADAVWHAAGDTSTDYNWYTKRGLLVGVYTSTELYMLTDNSPGYADTWASLQRRIEDVVQLGKAARDPTALLGALSGAAAGALSEAARLAARARKA